jgi:hypothetical protein
VTAQQKFVELTWQVANARQAVTNAAGNDEAQRFARLDLDRLIVDESNAAMNLRRAQQRLEATSGRFHSRPVLDPVLFLLPTLLFAFPGTFLGFQHLQAIRGSAPPRHRQTVGLIATLAWPLLLISAAVGSIILLPLNHGTWVNFGLSLAVIAVVTTNLWMVSRIVRWLSGSTWTEAFRAKPDRRNWLRWMGASVALAAVVVAVSSSQRSRTPPRFEPAGFAPAIQPPPIGNPRPDFPLPTTVANPAAAAELRVLQTQYEKTLNAVMEAERELALLNARTDLSASIRDVQA